MYSDIFCRVYNEFGWNYYPEAFGQQLLLWLRGRGLHPENAMDLACGTGILCGILQNAGIRAAGMDLSPGMIRVARENFPGLSFTVGDMTDFHPAEKYDLVTCTGDAINHIGSLSDVERVFRCVAGFLAPGGYFVFDLLNPREISDSEPFEMDFDARTRVRFQMTQPAPGKVDLCIRVWEDGRETLEEHIRETVHAPEAICALLKNAGLELTYLGDRLPEDSDTPSTTYYLAARLP